MKSPHAEVIVSCHSSVRLCVGRRMCLLWTDACRSLSQLHVRCISTANESIMSAARCREQFTTSQGRKAPTKLPTSSCRVLSRCRCQCHNHHLQQVTHTMEASVITCGANTFKDANWRGLENESAPVFSHFTCVLFLRLLQNLHRLEGKDRM